MFFFNTISFILFQIKITCNFEIFRIWHCKSKSRFYVSLSAILRGFDGRTPAVSGYKMVKKIILFLFVTYLAL